MDKSFYNSLLPDKDNSEEDNASSIFEDSSLHDNGEQQDSRLKVVLKRFYSVAIPYWSSEDKVQARVRLAIVFFLTLSTTALSVSFSFLGRDFYNALANKDAKQFKRQLIFYLLAFIGGIPVFVTRDYMRDLLAMRWRSWLTSHYITLYLKNRTFYNIEAKSLVDNPDQQIVHDVNIFTKNALDFSMAIFNAIVDLISFSNILYGIYPPLFLVLIGYSSMGTLCSIMLGKNLLIVSRNLNFFTSGYRYIIQLLPAAVVAPIYFSGKIDFGVVNQSFTAFDHILGDLSIVVYQFHSITSFTAIVNRLGVLLDILAQENIDQEATILNINESANAQPRIKKIDIFECSDSIDPLTKTLPLLSINHLTLQTPQYTLTLLKDLTFDVHQGDHLLVMGPSGSGKTSLLRAIAGLWQSGRGTIRTYLRCKNELDSRMENNEGESSNLDFGEIKEEESFGNRNDQWYNSMPFFLPQKPYMVQGSLRQQLLYPTWITPSKEEDSLNEDASCTENAQTCSSQTRPPPTNQELFEVLARVKVSYLYNRCNGLDSKVEWGTMLSQGEQQRIAFARILLSRPRLALMDESTSAIDEENEAHMYQELQAIGVTFVSVAHRGGLSRFHVNILTLYSSEMRQEGYTWTLKPSEGYMNAGL